MYDELVKRLREPCQYENCILCQQAADALEELSKRVDESIPKGDAEIIIEELSKPRWIPVTERLPKDLTMVIVFCEDGVSYGLCEHLIADDEEVVEWHDFLHYPITPTHWMPLPQAPKEET